MNCQFLVAPENPTVRLSLSAFTIGRSRTLLTWGYPPPLFLKIVPTHFSIGFAYARPGWRSPGCLPHAACRRTARVVCATVSGWWHDAQRVSRFSRSSVPPSVTGMMWLTSLPLSPQRWHVHSSRLRMMFLMRFHSAVLVLPSPHVIAFHLFPRVLACGCVVVPQEGFEPS